MKNRPRKSLAKAVQFSATLYFHDVPHLSASSLIEAWAREGYVSETDKDMDTGHEVFRGFRGATYVVLEKPEKARTAESPSHYPAVTEVNLDYDQTFLVNPQRAWHDFRSATHQAKLTFRILDSENDPTVAHNEWVAVLLGVQQVFPIQAMWFHELGVLVGRADLLEHTSYANTQDGQEGQFTPTLAFGTFITREGNKLKAWTTGLQHFGHSNLLVESNTISPLQAVSAVFNLGYTITGGRKYQPTETAHTSGISYRIQGGQGVDKNFLVLVPMM